MGSQILLYGAQPCDEGGVLMVFSSPLEGELTGSFWHMSYAQ